jgi:Uma2 family endonuclease
MATKTAISPEEYLAMRFEWEPEYVHGELIERPMPDRVHGEIETTLAALLRLLRKQHPVTPVTNMRCRLREGVYRLPDVALVANHPYERLPSIPPIMVTEILSRDDLYVDVVEKAAEYAAWGVPHIWLIDPWSKRLQIWTANSFATVERLELKDYGWNCSIDDLIEGIPAEALKR